MTVHRRSMRRIKTFHTKFSFSLNFRYGELIGSRIFPNSYVKYLRIVTWICNDLRGIIRMFVPYFSNSSNESLEPIFSFQLRYSNMHKLRRFVNYFYQVLACWLDTLFPFSNI